jgi:hypothetical protein
MRQSSLLASMWITDEKVKNPQVLSIQPHIIQIT